MILQHTLGHINCPACEEIKRAIMYSGHFADYLFPEGATLWLNSRKKISDTTRFHYSDCIKSLSQFFGEMRLRDIHIGNLAAYQDFRQEQIRQTKQHAAAKRGQPDDNTDGASRINHEISCVLRPVLKHAGLWAEIQKHYEPLPLPRESIGMALTEEEERHLFDVGRSQPRWVIAYYADLLSRNTTAGPGEIRNIKIKDINFDTATLMINGTKNEFRVRPVPINDDARRALDWMLDRYHAMCKRYSISSHGEHYLLFHRADKRDEAPDPTRPMGSWKRAHYAMRAEAAKKYPRLLHLRRYDFRHTACTDLLENPAIAYATIEHMMGHRLSSKTKRRYDHLRDSRLRVAADALNHNYAEDEIKKRQPTSVGLAAKASTAAG